MGIERGAKVQVRTAFDEMVKRRAASGVVRGIDFPVVLVCTEAEWEAAQAEGREPVTTPWPAEDVQPQEATPA